MHLRCVTFHIPGYIVHSVDIVIDVCAVWHISRELIKLTLSASTFSGCMRRDVHDTSEITHDPALQQCSQHPAKAIITCANALATGGAPTRAGGGGLRGLPVAVASTDWLMVLPDRSLYAAALAVLHECCSAILRSHLQAVELEWSKQSLEGVYMDGRSSGPRVID